jgi:hypothetical protein
MNDLSIALSNADGVVSASSVNDEHFAIVLGALCCEMGELIIQHRFLV